ncbi:hypothetical protein PRIPAC_74563, partial [Pristionchus pacificus]
RGGRQAYVNQKRTLNQILCSNSPPLPGLRGIMELCQIAITRFIDVVETWEFQISDMVMDCYNLTLTDWSRKYSCYSSFNCSADYSPQFSFFARQQSCQSRQILSVFYRFLFLFVQEIHQISTDGDPPDLQLKLFFFAHLSNKFFSSARLYPFFSRSSTKFSLRRFEKSSTHSKILQTKTIICEKLIVPF